MEKDLNWAVLGTGVIANEMAQALQKMGKTMYAVANRTHEKAVAFAEKYGIAKVYDSIDEVFVDDEVDIIDADLEEGQNNEETNYDIDKLDEIFSAEKVS